MRRLCPASDLLPAFRSRLTAAEGEAVDRLAALAAEAGSALYLVGGSVRDLLLEVGHLDLDFVVETDAVRLARAFGQETGAGVVLHESFRTAVIAGGGLACDLVTARSEHYPAPGALPVVRPADLESDLARRDFTINALALAVSGPAAGALTDPFTGRADLAAGVLRVLHPASFRDDATRLWRGARYAGRLNLTPDEQTRAAIADGLAYLAPISAARLHGELERVLDDPRPVASLRLLDRWGVLPATSPPLRCTAAQAVALSRLRRSDGWSHAAALAVLAARWRADEAEEVVARLGLGRAEARAVRAMPGLAAALRRLVRTQARPSVVVEALERVPAEALAGGRAFWTGTAAGALLERYEREWRLVRTALTAADLRALGVGEGPALGRTLWALRAARLDGQVASEADERALVAEVLAEPPTV